MAQVVGKVTIPKGKKLAVNIGCDFDAHALWLGSFNLSSPAYMSRGEFGAEVALPRVLKLFEKYKVRATFCVPGHTVDTWPSACREILAAGHEIAHHGYVHENPTPMSMEEESRVMEMGLEALARIGVKPRAYRSPAWDFSRNTLAVLEKYGFDCDSSLMANDFHPYRIRPVEVHMDKANVFGPPSRIVEVPVSWFLDDFPATEFVWGKLEGMNPSDMIFQRWKAMFDYALKREKQACYVVTTHPQTIGRAHMLPMMEDLIDYMKAKGAWFATLSEIYDATELPPS